MYEANRRTNLSEAIEKRTEECDVCHTEGVVGCQEEERAEVVDGTGTPGGFFGGQGTRTK